jgi:hypothetical protein
MNESKGLTRGDEYIKAFLGKRPYMSVTKEKRVVARFDVSWGIHMPETGKFGTWRHCIAYGDNALKVKDCKGGDYLNVTGFIVTNPVHDENGKLCLDNAGKAITKEYLIVDSVSVIPREKDVSQPKQLSLVA